MSHIYTYITHSEKETMKLGERLGKRLLIFPHNVLIYGDLGTGKTRFVQGIAKGMGIKEKIKSPTYTVMQEHKGKGVLTHYDLYRIEHIGHIDFMSFQEDFDDERKIVVVEWAKRLHARKVFYEAIKVEMELFGDKENERSIRIDLEIEKSPSIQKIKKLWKDFACPKNVQEHCRKVAYLSEIIANKMNEKNFIVNILLCKKAGFLHDLLRLVGIKDPEVSFMKEKVIPFMKTTWEKLSKEYKGLRHDQAAEVALKKMGYPELARIAGKHYFDSVAGEEGLSGWEEKIVFYADKRVLHEDIVSLDERFEDSRYRHHNGTFSENTKCLKKITYDLEKELSEIVGEDVGALR